VIGGMFHGGRVPWCCAGGRAEGYFFLLPPLWLLRLCVVGVGDAVCVSASVLAGAVCALVRDGCVRGRRSAGCPVYLRQKGFFAARSSWVRFLRDWLLSCLCFAPDARGGIRFARAEESKSLPCSVTVAIISPFAV
jgi:hypothetical protein